MWPVKIATTLSPLRMIPCQASLLAPATLAALAGRQRDPVGRRPAELLEHFQHDRLLTLDSKRVDRVQEINVQLLARRAREGEADVEVAADEEGSRAVGQRLRELSRRDLTSR